MKYYIKQKVFSLKDKFNVKDTSGNDLYKVEGKMFSIHNKIKLMNMNESVVLHAKKRLMKIFPTYDIFTPHDELVATVSRKFSLKPKFEVTLSQEELLVNGSLFAYSFTVEKRGEVVASVSKKIVSFGDSYEIDVVDSEEKELYLFIVIVLDQVLHEKKYHNR